MLTDNTEEIDNKDIHDFCPSGLNGVYIERMIDLDGVKGNMISHTGAKFN